MCQMLDRTMWNAAIGNGKRQEFDTVTGAKGRFGAEFEFCYFSGLQQRHHRSEPSGTLPLPYLGPQANPRRVGAA